MAVPKVDRETTHSLQTRESIPTEAHPSCREMPPAPSSPCFMVSGGKDFKLQVEWAAT